MFLRIFGDSVERIIDEERRLFYVAVTRAKDSLALLTEIDSQSPFLNDISRNFPLAPLSWSDLPPIPALDGTRLEIRVSNAYDVRNMLKEQGFTWNPKKKYWYRIDMAEGFSMDLLLVQSWARDGVSVEVLSETGELLHRR